MVRVEAVEYLAEAVGIRRLDEEVVVVVNLNHPVLHAAEFTTYLPKCHSSSSASAVFLKHFPISSSFPTTRIHHLMLASSAYV